MDDFPPPLPTGTASRTLVHPARGWLLVVLGVGLSAGMAFLSRFLHALVLENEKSGTHSRWHGSPEFTRTVFELFGTVFVFGLVAIVAGVYILRTRRINYVLGGILALLGLGMGYLGYVIVQTHVPR